MPRLPNLVDRDQIPAHLHEAYDRVAEQRNGAVSGPYGVLLHSPEVAIRAASLGNFVRWNSALTARQRELAILTLARHLDAEVMWAGHVRLGREAGIDDEVIEVIANRGELDDLADEDADIVRYVRDLASTNRVSQDAFNTLHSRLGDQGIVNLASLVGYYAFVGTILNTFEIEPPADGARLPPV